MSRRAIRAVISMALILFSSGCAYRMQAGSPAGSYRLRVIATSPESFVVRIQASANQEYHIPADGRVTLDVPASRRACSVYLFNKIPISRSYDPLAMKSIQLSVAGKPVRKFSFYDLFKLPKDNDGYHLLTPR